jgi:hypothetical protein
MFGSSVIPCHWRVHGRAAGWTVVRREYDTPPRISRWRDLTVTAIKRLLGRIWCFGKRHRLAVCLCLAIVLLPSLAVAYSATAPKNYAATVQAVVYVHGRDPLTETTTLTRKQLKPYLSTLASLDLAEAALKRLPEGQPRGMTAIVAASRELLHETTVSLGPTGTTLDITARASSAPRAVAIADAFVGALQERRASEAQSIARQAVARGLELAASLPRGSQAREAAIAGYVRHLLPVVPDQNVQIVRPAAAASSHFLIVVAVATGIVVFALLMLLMLVGVWRPQADRA